MFIPYFIVIIWYCKYHPLLELDVTYCIFLLWIWHCFKSDYMLFWHLNFQETEGTNLGFWRGLANEKRIGRHVTNIFWTSKSSKEPSCHHKICINFFCIEGKWCDWNLLEEVTYTSQWRRKGNLDQWQVLEAENLAPESNQMEGMANLWYGMLWKGATDCLNILLEDCL